MAGTERLVVKPDGSLRSWTRRRDNTPRPWLLSKFTFPILEQHLEAESHKAFGTASFEERNAVMANAIADVESVSIVRVTDNTRSLPQIRTRLMQAVMQAGEPYSDEGNSDAGRLARPIALKSLSAILEASGIEQLDMRAVMDRIDIAHIVPLAAKILNITPPDYSRDELTQVLSDNMRPTDGFRAQAEQVFSEAPLTTQEEMSIDVLLRLSHATWMIRKVHEAYTKDDETIMSGNEQVNPYEVMVQQQYERLLAEGKSSDVALVLSAWNMYKDCRRSTGESLSSMLPN